MRNVFKLFSYDIKHLFGNVITVVIVLGLVFLPSIFTWYNVIACWNVFDNTGNLKVAVANSDEGYQSDLLPTKINVGDSVESALRANDQLDWVFTDEEDAIDGARSGKYYAAVVIPQSFSSDMMSFYSDDAEHRRAHLLREREEERRGAARDRSGVQQGCRPGEHHVRRDHLRCGPGADRFAGDGADDADAAGQVAKLSGTISSSADQMRTAADVLESYANLAGTAQALVGKFHPASGQCAKRGEGCAAAGLGGEKRRRDHRRCADDVGFVLVRCPGPKLRRLQSGARGHR